MTRRQFLLAVPAVVTIAALPMALRKQITINGPRGRWVRYDEFGDRRIPRPVNAQMREFYARVET